jgi:hypothetical protein
MFSSVSELNRDGNAPTAPSRPGALFVVEFMAIGRPIALDQVRILEAIPDRFQRRLEAVPVEGPADVGLEHDPLRPRGRDGEMHLLAMELLEHGTDDGRPLGSSAPRRHPVALTCIQRVHDHDRQPELEGG